MTAEVNLMVWESGLVGQGESWGWVEGQERWGCVCWGSGEFVMGKWNGRDIDREREDQEE